MSKKSKISFSANDGVDFSFDINKAIKNFDTIDKKKINKEEVIEQSNVFVNDLDNNDNLKKLDLIKNLDNNVQNNIKISNTTKINDNNKTTNVAIEEIDSKTILLERERSKLKLQNSENNKNSSKNLANKFRKNNSLDQRNFNRNSKGSGSDIYTIKSKLAAVDRIMDMNNHEIDETLGNVINVRSASIKPSTHTMEKFKKQKIGSGIDIFNGPIVRSININDNGIVVENLASQLSVKVKHLITLLYNVGIKVKALDILDADTAQLISEENGHTVVRISDNIIETEFLKQIESSHSDICFRSPIVSIMGHVDHGKTSILDYIRKTKLTSKEAGGITQSIGAYQVDYNGKNITFIDTPGHEAFIKMRSKGAGLTDIAIVVVAANDGIMPQTIESIKHAKIANVPIIIAINKIDLSDANVEKVKNNLMEYDIVPEDFGGDIMICPVSAVSGQGIDNLLKSILTLAEMMEIKSYNKGLADGIILESKIDTKRGVLTTVIIKNGYFESGDFIISGAASGKVKSIFDSNGKIIHMATVSMPVEILGLDSTVESGQKFYSIKKEKDAIDYIKYIKDKLNSRIRLLKDGMTRKLALATFKENSSNLDKKNVNIIVKSDTIDSLDAVLTMIKNLRFNDININIISTGIGVVSKSDVEFASKSNSIIFGFNIKILNKDVEFQINQQKVDVKLFDIIYRLIDDLQLLVKNLLKPEISLVLKGKAEIREIFNFKSIKVVGCYVIDGKIFNRHKVKIFRGDNLILETKIDNLKRMKDNVQDVGKGYECGVNLSENNGIKIGDIIECWGN